MDRDRNIVMGLGSNTNSQKNKNTIPITTTPPEGPTIYWDLEDLDEDSEHGLDFEDTYLIQNNL